MIKLIDSSEAKLQIYVSTQLKNLFPDEFRDEDKVIGAYLSESLLRLERCINSVRMWKSGEFNYLHSSQYAIFLYYLANTIWRREKNVRVCSKLFYLNKTLNGIDCFYEIEMPEVFFIGHSVGIVLAKATYGNFLVLYQNSTVGKNHGEAPVLGEGVVMYPNTAIIGKSTIANGSIISQGVSVINRATKEGSIVYQGQRGELVFKKSERDILSDFFRK
jgi:serine O-acetyltransferase